MCKGPVTSKIVYTAKRSATIRQFGTKTQLPLKVGLSSTLTDRSPDLSRVREALSHHAAVRCYLFDELTKG